MLARLTAFVVWALVAATAVFWGLRMLVRPQPAPAYAVAVGDAAAMRGDLSRLLGATPVAAAGPAMAAPELASRFKLIGVMANKQRDGNGYALIAVDAKPARAYPVGARLDGDIVLQSVSLRTAAIGAAQGSPAATLEIPALPAPATGTLPGPGDGVRFGAAAAPPPLPLPSPGMVPQGLPPSTVTPPDQQGQPPGPRSRAPGVANR
jgi:general secretion pathway protein C